MHSSHQGQMADIYNRSFEGPTDAAEILIHVESSNDAFGRVGDSKTATVKVSLTNMIKLNLFISVWLRGFPKESSQELCQLC